jgi:hypothetical protein
VANTNILQELDQDFDTAEEWLLYYPERLKLYYQDLNYISGGTAAVPEVFVQTGPGDIVLHRVVSLSELDKTEKWLITVEMVQDMLGPKKKLFLDLRRKAADRKKTVNGREVWRSYVQKQFADEMARQYNGVPEKFWLSDQSLSAWWKNIVELMRLVALKRGCF